MDGNEEEGEIENVDFGWIQNEVDDLQRQIQNHFNENHNQEFQQQNNYPVQQILEIPRNQNFQIANENEGGILIYPE